MFSKVLFPTDFTDEADRALKFLIGLKKFNLKQVDLVHVADFRTASVWPLPPSVQQTINDRLAERRGWLIKEGIKAESILIEGNPTEDILTTANKGGYSLIVTGSHGKNLLEELLLGSVSEALTREAKVPVLTIRHDLLKEWEKQGTLEAKSSGLFSKVLFTTDFSAASEKAYKLVKDLHFFGCRQVILLHVIDPKKMETESQKEELKEQCSLNCDEMKHELRKYKYKVENYCLEGDPITEITELAAKKQASLIVMGSHGKSVIKEWLIGSISLGVIRTAAKPVLVVHRQ